MMRWLVVMLLAAGGAAPVIAAAQLPPLALPDAAAADPLSAGTGTIAILALGLAMLNGAHRRRRAVPRVTA